MADANETCPGARWRELAVVIHDVARRARPEALTRAGLEPITPSIGEVLRAVSRAPGRTVQEIAAEVGMQATNTSAAVTFLAKRGLVERAHDAQDRRRVRLMPTAKALADSDRIENAWGNSYLDASAKLSQRQVESLLAAIPALQALDEALASEGAVDGVAG